MKRGFLERFQHGIGIADDATADGVPRLAAQIVGPFHHFVKKPAFSGKVTLAFLSSQGRFCRCESRPENELPKTYRIPGFASSLVLHLFRPAQSLIKQCDSSRCPSTAFRSFLFGAKIMSLTGRRLFLTLLLLSQCGSVSLLPAQEAAPKLTIGDQAPKWNNLPGTDDQQHSLEQLSGKQVVVVCFTCNSCPYAVDYENRMIALQKKYADHPKGVVLVAINANRKPSEQLDKMKERAKEKNFPFAYLMDESQKVAEAYGANFTPEFFVLNQDRSLIYKGAMDDKTDESLASVNYVELAIESALQGKLPETREVPARGCAIPYKRSRR